MVSRFGKGALMAKFDVESVYQNIAIHPADRYEMAWPILCGLGTPLQITLCPLYLQYSCRGGGIDPVELLQCSRFTSLPGRLYYSWALRLPSMCSKPGHSVSCLQEIGLAPSSWQVRGALPSSNGVGHWTEFSRASGSSAKVVWPGRTFFQRMIDLLCCFQKKDHPIRLNQEFYVDLSWWHHFLDQWHGISFWLYPGLSPATDLEVSSDAAGSLGFRAFYKRPVVLWYMGYFSKSQSIAYKELFPVVIARHVWGPQWCKRHVWQWWCGPYFEFLHFQDSMSYAFFAQFAVLLWLS